MEAIFATQPPLRLTQAACQALDIARSSLFRHRARLKRPVSQPNKRAGPPRALSAAERQAVRDILHQPRFADQAPAEVYAALLDEGAYHCSIRTMYRTLASMAKCASAADSVAIRSTPNPNCWPPAPTRCGPGTSQS